MIYHSGFTGCRTFFGGFFAQLSAKFVQKTLLPARFQACSRLLADHNGEIPY
jgi:hypothetical protein